MNKLALYTLTTVLIALTILAVISIRTAFYGDRIREKAYPLPEREVERPEPVPEWVPEAASPQYSTDDAASSELDADIDMEFVPMNPGTVIERPAAPEIVESDIQQVMDQLTPGEVAFNSPDIIELGETELIQVVLTTSSQTGTEELKGHITAIGEKRHTEIQVANEMIAKLAGSAFDIVSLGDERQLTVGSEITEWRWEVTPRQEGPQELYLTMSAVLSFQGREVVKAYPVYDTTITVNVPWSKRVASFIDGNWKWLWTTILVPGYGWLIAAFRKYRARRKVA